MRKTPRGQCRHRRVHAPGVSDTIAIERRVKKEKKKRARWKSRPVLECRGTLQCGRTWCSLPPLPPPTVSFFHPDVPPSFLFLSFLFLSVSPATPDCKSASCTGCFRCNWISSFALTLISKIFLATPSLAPRLSEMFSTSFLQRLWTFFFNSTLSPNDSFVAFNRNFIDLSRCILEIRIIFIKIYEQRPSLRWTILRVSFILISTSYTSFIRIQVSYGQR